MDDLEDIINSVVKCEYKENDIIIKQGDDANELFIVDNGNLKC